MSKRHLREDLLKRFITYALALFVIFTLIITGFFAFSSITVSKQMNEQVVEIIQNQLVNSIDPSINEMKNKYKLHFENDSACTPGTLVYLSDLEVINYDGIVLNSLCGYSNSVGLDKSKLPVFKDILNNQPEFILYGTTSVDSISGTVKTRIGYRNDDHIIIGTVGFDDFEELIGKRVENKAIVAIVDENGSYLYNDDGKKVAQREVDPNFLDIMKGNIKSGDIVKYEGDRNYIYVSHVEGTDWEVIIYQNQMEILEPVIQISFIIIIMIFVLVILLTMNINEVLKKVESNLSSFSGAVISVSDGKYEPINYDNQYEEFQNVSIKMNEMIDQIDEREREITLLNESLELSYLNTLTVLAKAIEAKDRYTGSHCERVSYYSLIIGEKLGLNESQMYQLRYGSLLHDIGKISIAEAILLKPSRLQESEFEAIMDHPSSGHLLVRDLPNFSKAKEIVLYHHERFDGKGYPSGLEGKNIPLLARIVCVADAFDAMTSNRIYRTGIMMNKDAFAELKSCSHTQFDPEIVEQFIEVMTQLENA